MESSKPEKNVMQELLFLEPSVVLLSVLTFLFDPFAEKLQANAPRDQNVVDLLQADNWFATQE
jgi:hypothetical protein